MPSNSKWAGRPVWTGLVCAARGSNGGAAAGEAGSGGGGGWRLGEGEKGGAEQVGRGWVVRGTVGADVKGACGPHHGKANFVTSQTNLPKKTKSCICVSTQQPF